MDLINLVAVRRVARRFGLRPVGDDEDWTVYWTDTSVLLERVMDMKRYQARLGTVMLHHIDGRVSYYSTIYGYMWGLCMRFCPA